MMFVLNGSFVLNSSFVPLRNTKDATLQMILMFFALTLDSIIPKALVKKVTPKAPSAT